jgi:hypothetical protein
MDEGGGEGGGGGGGEGGGEGGGGGGGEGQDQDQGQGADECSFTIDDILEECLYNKYCKCQDNFRVWHGGEYAGIAAKMRAYTALHKVVQQCHAQIVLPALQYRALFENVPTIAQADAEWDRHMDTATPMTINLHHFSDMSIDELAVYDKVTSKKVRLVANGDRLAVEPLSRPRNKMADVVGGDGSGHTSYSWYGSSAMHCRDFVESHKHGVSKVQLWLTFNKLNPDFGTMLKTNAKATFMTPTPMGLFNNFNKDPAQGTMVAGTSIVEMGIGPACTVRSVGHTLTGAQAPGTPL